MTQFIESFSEEVWTQTYKDYNDTDINDNLKRVAKAIASVENTEDKRAFWESEFYDMLSDFKGTCGGRTYSNAGTEWKGTTLLNCFVSPRRTDDIDSLDAIIEDLKNQSFTLKSEGGWGQNFSWIRPRGAFIAGVGVETPGAVKYMELYDKASEIITSGSGKKSTNKKSKGKIRKGAMMGVLDVWHPDIIEFITAKQSSGRLTKFNLSVNFTNEFMNCLNQINSLDKIKDADKIEELDKWELKFPDTAFEKYKDEWDGDITSWNSKNYPVVVYQTVSIIWLWNLVMESTYNRAEPGVLFLDRANEYNPLYYGEKIVATNPCFTGDTIVAVADGRNGISIKQLAEESQGKFIFPVYSASYKKRSGWKSEIKNAIAFKTGTKEIVEVVLSNGTSFKCTPDHKLATKNGDYVIAELSEGVQLQDFYTFSNKNTAKSYRHINSKSNGYAKQYRMMFEHTHGSYDGKEFNIDHIDNDSTNDLLENLQLISILDHKNKTPRAGLDNPIHRCDPEHRSLYSKRTCIFGNGKKYNWSEERIAAALQKFDETYGSITREDKNVYMNEQIFVQEVIFLDEVQDVYDLTVEDNHNFYIITNTDDEKFLNCSGVLVHNCGEQTLAPAGVCCLGSLNLTQFVESDTFNLQKISKYTKIMVRFLDNVNEYSGAPLPEYIDSMHHKRRIGIGIMGWGSALFMLRTKFASETANKLRDQIMSTIAVSAYEASIDLAIEKGMFKYCDPIKHSEGKFVNSIGLSAVYMSKLSTTGIRNSSLLSVQPTGNTGIVANMVSGGLEPIFMPEYTRTVIVNRIPDHMTEITPKWFEGEWKETDQFKFAKEGDEEILKATINDVVYKIDKNRGLTKEVSCKDYGLRWLQNNNQWDSTADWAATALTGLTADDHLNDLIGFAKFVDSAMSKTINVPNEYEFVDFKNIYIKAYNSGVVKGVTTYRSGTMTAVLSSKENTTNGYDEEVILDSIKMPDSADASMKILRAEGRKWYLTVVWNETKSRPQAIFVHTNHHEKTVTTHDAFDRLVQLAKEKNIPPEFILDVTKKVSGDPNPTKITRILSLLLRHGVLIKNIIAVLDKVDNVFVGSFLFQIKKFLSSFIKDGEKAEGEVCQECGSDKVVYQEGCKICLSCGSSKCG